MKISRNEQRKKRARRIRARVTGTASRPRVHVYRSLVNFSAQITDDTTGTTLVAASLKDTKNAKNTVDGAKEVARVLSKKAQDKKISDVVFDRSGYKYHGKVKAFADELRASGLKF